MIFSKNEVKNHEISVRHINGSIRKFLVHAVLFKNKSGEKYIVSIGRDVTEYFDVKRKQEESEAKYKLVFDKMLNAFFILEPIHGAEGDIVDMLYVDANPAYETQTQYKRDELIGRKWSEKTKLEKAKFIEVLHSYKSILENGDGKNYEIYSANEDQHYSVCAFKINDNQIGVIFENVTENKKALESIKRMNDELEKRVLERTRELEHAVEGLDNFTEIVSHDLKSPLRVIEGYTRIIMEDHSNVIGHDVREIINQIRDINTDLMEMINKLLQYSRDIKLEIHREDVNLKEIIDSVFKEIRISDIQRRIELVFIDELQLVKADRILIKSVIYNLVTNAFKFTRDADPGVIEVGYSCKGDEHIFFIRDNGAGFNEEYSYKLFNPFQRLHNTGEYPGSGIGLASSKEIIRKHGGRIWAEGKLGRGATVYFTLPV